MQPTTDVIGISHFFIAKRGAEVRFIGAICDSTPKLPAVWVGEICSGCGMDPGNGTSGYSECCGAEVTYTEAMSYADKVAYAEAMWETLPPVQNKVFALFEGRHELPANSGALYSNSTTGPQGLVRNENCFKEALTALEAGNPVQVICTGLTAALCDFIAEAIKVKNSTLIVLHHDRETNTYWSQLII